MKWANFLHIYQPAGQQPDILASIVTQSYRPLLEGIRSNNKVRLTLNINGSLLEMFDQHGYRDLIDIIRHLLKEGQIELTGSTKFHALLPFLSEKEAIHQIQENTSTLNFYTDKLYQSTGFFPPEMAYDEKIPNIVEQLGFKWIIIDEIAFGGKTGQVDYNKTYKIKNSNLSVFFRERRPSNLIMSAVIRSYESFREAMGEEFVGDRYMITGMDGETFGHHRPGLDKILFDIFRSKELELVQVSDLLKYYPNNQELVPNKSTWASSEQDIEKGIQFLSWNDPENEIHHWQWELVNLTLNSIYEMDQKSMHYAELRRSMDEALASDHFWWASAKPWWSVEEIERGAFKCLAILRSMFGGNNEKIEQARLLYEKIVSTAFQWQRTGKIHNMMQSYKTVVRIPFKERTLEKGGLKEAEYNAFISMFRNLEAEAAKKGEYEKAILWRDAVLKIENKSDIYDTIHAVDLLRITIPNYEVDQIIKKYEEDYKKIRGGQPEQRGS